MAVRKTIKTTIIAFDPGDHQSLFYRAWRLMNLAGPLTPREFTPDLGAIETELTKYADQMRRQQVHIDEIKRICHVRT